MGLLTSMLAETMNNDEITIIKMEDFYLDSDYKSLNEQLDSFSNDLLKQLGVKQKFDTAMDVSRIKYRFENGTILLAKLNNKTVGYAQAMFNKETNVCYISELVVDKNIRGTGIGKKLLSILISNAKENGMQHFSLSCIANNAYALKLYKSFGFKLMTYVMFK